MRIVIDQTTLSVLCQARKSTSRPDILGYPHSLPLLLVPTRHQHPNCRHVDVQIYNRALPLWIDLSQDLDVRCGSTGVKDQVRTRVQMHKRQGEIKKRHVRRQRMRTVLVVVLPDFVLAPMNCGVHNDWAQYMKITPFSILTYLWNLPLPWTCSSVLWSMSLSMVTSRDQDERNIFKKIEKQTWLWLGSYGRGFSTDVKSSLRAVSWFLKLSIHSFFASNVSMHTISDWHEWWEIW